MTIWKLTSDIRWGCMASRFATWMYGILGAAASKPAANDVMLDYFLSTLDVRSRGLAPSVTADDAKALLADVRTSLDGFQTKYQPTAATLNEAAWNEAYRLERLLALIEPSDQLWPELKRRVAEATEEGLSAAPRLSAAADIAGQLAFDKAATPPALIPSSVPILRALLLDTLEELHWAAQRKFYSRPIRKGATSRIVICGMGTFCFFVLPYVLLYIDFWLGHPISAAGWAWLPLYSVLTSGLFGALFSRLLYLQQNWDALTIGGLKDARDFTSIVLRGCVGMTGAVIISFFLQSSVLGGSLFPDFSKIGLETKVYPAPDTTSEKPGAQPISPPAVTLHLIYPSQALALLVVWSFLAGFSERLVPSILKNTETSIGKTNKS